MGFAYNFEKIELKTKIFIITKKSKIKTTVTVLKLRGYNFMEQCILLNCFNILVN